MQFMLDGVVVNRGVVAHLLDINSFKLQLAVRHYIFAS